MASQPWTQEPEEEQPRKERKAEPTLQLGKNIAQMARQIWLAGLGAMAATGEEGSQLFRTLVERGKEVEPTLSEGWSKVREEWGEKVQRMGQQVRTRAEEAMPDREKLMRQAMERMDLPTRHDLEELSHRVEVLSRKVDKLAGAAAHHEEPAKPAVKTVAKKAPAARTRRTAKG